MTVYSQPIEADQTGGVDASAILNEWLELCVLAPGDVVKLTGVLRLDTSLALGTAQRSVTGVTFDLTGARLTMLTPITSHYGFPIVRAANLHDCVVMLGTIAGANILTGDAVKAGKEAFAGISVGGGATDVVISGGTIERVWGDFVFIGAGPNRNITIEGTIGRGSGRHAISARQCDGLTVHGVDMIGHRHLFFDHEPAAGEGITNVDIGDSTSTEGGHGFLQLAPLPSTTLGNISVHDHRLTSGHYRVTAGAGGVQRQGFTLVHLHRSLSDPIVTLPLITIGGTAGGWEGVQIADVQETVKRADLIPRIVRVSPLCTAVNVDPSGFASVA